MKKSFNERLDAIEEETQALRDEQSEDNSVILVPDSLVPDSIHIEETGCGDGLAIVFNDDKQELHYSEANGSDIYSVTYAEKNDFVKCKLVKCERNDLEAGDTAYHTDYDDGDFSKHSRYCKILGSKKYAYVDCDEDIIVTDNDWNYWFKVVKVKE